MKIEKLLNNIDRNDIINILTKKNSEKRVNHILGVEEMAVILADIYNIDKVKVITAALLHDIAKEYTLKECLDTLNKFNVYYDDMEGKSVELLHSKVAFAITKYDFLIRDEDVLNAIKYHTTGRGEMTMIEKIIFVSDAIEKNRNYIGVEEIRVMAKNNIDASMIMILDNTIKYLISKNETIHINTLICRNSVLESRRKHEKIF